jgi:ADP-ribosylglycohydrolase
LEGTSYEDVVRKAVSLGGDTDTQGCIAGSIAEAFYGIPDELLVRINEYLPQDMLDICEQFRRRIIL